MKLVVKCPKCGEENKAPKKHDNRIDYAKKYGDKFSLNCVKCDGSNEYHVDEIKAMDYGFGELIKNRLIILIIIFILTIALGFFFIGVLGALVISSISVFVSALFIKKNASDKNLEFNRHKLKGRTGLAFKK